MTEVYPKAEKYISPLTNCDISALRLKPHTLLLTRSGTIGRVSYVSRTLEGCVYSDDVIRITFKNSYDLGYVYTYLKSKTGNIILQTNGYGSVITHLEPEHLTEIQVPDAPAVLRQRINSLVEESYALRLDASYHVPAAAAIAAHLKRHAAQVTTAGDSRISRAVILPGRFKRIYVQEGYGVTFFSGKNIGELDPSDKRYLSFSQHDRKIREELTISENMILVTCSGTVGHVALVPKHWDGWAMTHDIIRYIPQDGMVGYVYVWLSSEYANVLLQAQAYGSVVQHIEREHFMEIPVPLLRDQEVQRKIHDLALEANAKRYEAYKLEQEALRLMDDEVIAAK